MEGYTYRLPNAVIQLVIDSWLNIAYNKTKVLIQLNCFMKNFLHYFFKLVQCLIRSSVIIV
jgi:hypothetical protein